MEKNHIIKIKVWNPIEPNYVITKKGVVSFDKQQSLYNFKFDFNDGSEHLNPEMISNLDKRTKLTAEVFDEFFIPGVGYHSVSIFTIPCLTVDLLPFSYQRDKAFLHYLNQEEPYLFTCNFRFKPYSKGESNRYPNQDIFLDEIKLDVPSDRISLYITSRRNFFEPESKA